MILSLHGIVNKIATVVVDLVSGLFAAWNAETLGTTLDSSIYRVYNGDNLNDTSGNAQNGTNVNNVTFTTGKIGNAFTFNGSNYISLPNNALNLVGDFSISFWYYPNVVGVEKYILGNYNSNTGGGNPNGTGFIVATTTSNQIGIATYNAGYDTIYSQTNMLTVNTWCHVTITRKSGTRSRVYINSSLNQSNTLPKDPVYPQATYQSTIGQVPGIGGHINGKIEALTIWNKELTADEVVSVYNAGNGAEFPFSSQILPSLKDSVGLNHGIRDVSTVSGGVYGPSFVTGKIGKAFQFDGVNDYVLLPDNSLNLTGDFAISVWVYYTASGAQNIISNEIYQTTPSNIYKGWSIQIDNLSATTNKVNFFIAKGTTTTYTGWEFTTTSLTQNAWNHIFIQRVASTNTYCWINNVSQSYTLRGTGADITFNPTYHTTQYCSIGAEKYASASVANYMKANSKIDALTIWNRQLTTNERIELYNSGNGVQLP